ncbi:MAG: tetratricopeptide repeat protein [Acidobacteria bacterium]|nr:tetratricopeptide repeat protein [Acidobacteriota bacterium]
MVATVAPATAPATPATAGSAPALINEAELKTYRDILARDPKNVEAAIRLGNMLYDAQRYSEAIPYYQQALTIQPQNVNVSTDLGTALWYSGHADRALAQYDKSLAIDADHSQTLFNVGIVRLDGKQDPRGAIEVWEKLLSVEPGYANAAKVRELISTARTKSFDASF